MFIYMVCRILSFASQVTSEMIDVIVCLTHQLSPLNTPWGVNGVGITLSSELSSVLSWTTSAD
jgi:hypothetical protein